MSSTVHSQVVNLMRGAASLMEARLFWICAANDKEIIHTFQSIGPIADLII